MQPPVITGLGLWTGLGNGTSAFWDGLLAGRRPLTPVTGLRMTNLRCRVAVSVPVSVPVGSKRGHLLDGAVREALAAADLPSLPAGTLVVLAGHVAATGSQDTDPDFEEQLWRFPINRDWVSGRTTQTVMSHACASALFGLAFAATWLAAGNGDLALVAGATVINSYEFVGMDVTRALSPTGARPFDSRRDGTTIGEGAGAVLLENAGHARERGAAAMARMAGAHCLISGASPSDSETLAVGACVRAACADAESALCTTVRPGYVHAHAAGTVQGDEAELAALEALAEEGDWEDLLVSSHKGATGHLLHAAAFPAVVAAVIALRSGLVPGTPGLREPARRGRLVLPVTATPAPGMDVVVVNGFGFGGNNASVVLAAAEE
jgi:3-oxoacyl-[acyl-carrier-protein] synthase II